MRTIRTTGKCILAGEHSVVRGKMALVTPLPSRSLTLSYEPAPAFSVEAGPLAEPFRLALREIGELPAFRFSLASDIPTSAGLGSSAALSVAAARFLREEELSREKEFTLALRMENLFHGKSSGLDLAAVSHDAPILFRRGEAPSPVRSRWRPPFYLADTGLRSSTKSCVEKVASLGREDLDDRMEAAVFRMEDALAREDLSLLAEAVEEAALCFREWGLVPATVAEQTEELKRRGALAVKPTGSGDGGFLLSLWAERPPAELGLIPVWAGS